VIRIQIGRNNYKGAYLWSDITLEQYITLAGIPIPAKYQNYVLVNERFDSNKKETVDQYMDAITEFTEEDLTVTFPEFYKRIIKVLTTIPLEEINRMKEEQITQVYDYHLRPFVLSLIYNTPVISLFGAIKEYEAPMMKRIRIGARIYHFPETVRIQGEEIPLAKEPIITYSEACDLFRESGGFTKQDIASLPLLMAIYCRPKGEAYNEKRSLERQDIFRKARMDQVWSLFFYTSQRLYGSGNFTLLFSAIPKAIKTIARNARTLATSETGA